MDFDPTGNRLATIDEAGVKLVSDVTEGTKILFYHKEDKGVGSWRNRCKLNPIFEDPIVAFSSGSGFLELYDIEKDARLNKKDIILEEQNSNVS